MSETIHDFAHGIPAPAALLDAMRDDAPWLSFLTDRERAILKQFAAVIVPDRPITRRLTRHVVCTPTGHKYYAARTFEEALAYVEASELAPVGVVCGGRAYVVSPPSSPPPPSDPNQLGLFDKA